MGWLIDLAKTAAPEPMPSADPTSDPDRQQDPDPDLPGVSGEFIPARPDPTAPLPPAESAILEELDDPDCPGIDPAELEAGIKAAIVRDLFVRPEHVEALKADPLWWRVSITEPGGRTVEVDTPSGWIMSDWRAYADRYHGPECTLAPIAAPPKPTGTGQPRGVAGACDGVAGLTPTQFRALLSAEDLADIEAGAIHRKTLHGYAMSFAEGIDAGRIVVPGGEP